LDGTLTWSGTGDIRIYGSALFPPTNFTRTFSGSYTFRSTTPGKTITSNGQTITSGAVTFDGVGGAWTLADAFSNTNSFTITNGSFSTGGFVLTVNSLSSSNTNVRSINLGASTVNLIQTSTVIDFSTPTNLTFTAGTSQINCTTTSGFVSIAGGGLTFYNLALPSATSISATHNISGANTFNNLTISPPTGTGVTVCSIAANQIINGTLTCAGASSIRRVTLLSNTIGTARTLTAAAFVATDCDFRDITIAGAAASTAPTRAGNCGGNSGITFPVAKTVYWNLAGSQSFAATAWATTPGGTPDVNNFPLAQDTATFTDSGAADTVIINNSNFNYPSIDALGRTSALALNYAGASLNYYGNFILGSGITLSGVNTATFSGRGSYSITSSGKTFTGSTEFNCVSGTYTFTDAHTNSIAVAITSGTVNTNNQTITTPIFNLNAGVITKVLNLGTSTINLTGTGTVWSFSTIVGLTLNAGSSTINLTDTSATARTFQGGGLTYGTLVIGGSTGTSTLNLAGTGTTFNNIISNW
jgi:hypothetical protein